MGYIDSFILNCDVHCWLINSHWCTWHLIGAKLPLYTFSRSNALSFATEKQPCSPFLHALFKEVKCQDLILMLKQLRKEIDLFFSFCFFHAFLFNLSGRSGRPGTCSTMTLPIVQWRYGVWFFLLRSRIIMTCCAWHWIGLLDWQERPINTRLG
jgi:hypothetical protein